MPGAFATAGTPLSTRELQLAYLLSTTFAVVEHLARLIEAKHCAEYAERVLMWIGRGRRFEVDRAPRAGIVAAHLLQVASCIPLHLQVEIVTTFDGRDHLRWFRAGTRA